MSDRNRGKNTNVTVFPFQLQIVKPKVQIQYLKYLRFGLWLTIKSKSACTEVAKLARSVFS